MRILKGKSLHLFNKAIEKGRLTQIKNGKSKGKNNPSYGKVYHSKSGFRKDLGHSVRSSWEANVCRILNKYNIVYEYEKHTFKLKDGTTYTPDIFIPIFNKFYEIKGFSRNNKYEIFKEEYPHIKIKIIKEKLYKRIIKKFCIDIKINDKDTEYSKNDINQLFLKYCLENEKRPCVVEFCKKSNISVSLIKNIFGKVINLFNENRSYIRDIELNRLKNKFREYIIINNNVPSYKNFQKFYKRMPSIIRNYYDDNYSLFKSETLSEQGKTKHESSRS